jgi:Putative zinc-finger
MTTQPNTDNQQHDSIWELLPWYVNESLSPQESAEVESHLSACPLCQAEVARCNNLNQSVKSNPQDTWKPSAPHFAKILNNVDAIEQRATTKKSAGWLANWLPWLSATPGPARFALGLQGALVLALATTLLYRGLVPTDDYRTLSDPAPATQITGPQIRVVFAEDITEKEMRTLLLNISSRLIAGPSSLGVYTIALSSEHSVPNANHAIAQLRAHPKVRLAEIVGANIE